MIMGVTFGQRHRRTCYYRGLRFLVHALNKCQYASTNKPYTKYLNSVFFCLFVLCSEDVNCFIYLYFYSELKGMISLIQKNMAVLTLVKNQKQKSAKQQCQVKLEECETLS